MQSLESLITETLRERATSARAKWPGRTGSRSWRASRTGSQKRRPASYRRCCSITSQVGSRLGRESRSSARKADTTYCSANFCFGTKRTCPQAPINVRFRDQAGSTDAVIE